MSCLQTASWLHFSDSFSSSRSARRSSLVVHALSALRDAQRLNMVAHGNHPSPIRYPTLAKSIFFPPPSVLSTRFCGGLRPITPSLPRSDSLIWFTSPKALLRANLISTVSGQSTLILSFVTAISLHLLWSSSTTPRTIEPTGSRAIYSWMRFLLQLHYRLCMCLRSEATLWTRLGSHFRRISASNRRHFRLTPPDTCLLSCVTQAPNPAVEITAPARHAPCGGTLPAVLPP